MRLFREEAAPLRGRETQEVLAVGSGKGGVGKTCFSVNLAVEIARRGWRVLLVDGDLSCSNVETLLGTRSDTALDDFFSQNGAKTLAPLIRDTPYENLRVIPGTTGLLHVANPRYQQKAALIRELARQEADLVLLDLDAGAHLNTLDLFLVTKSHGICVITPEKTSIDNAFKFLRSALFRRIESFYRSPEVALLLRRSETIRGFLDEVRGSGLLEERTREQVCGEIVRLARSMRPQIVVNRARNGYEARVAANVLSKHLRQLLMVEPCHVGFVYFDKHVPEAVNSGVPFVVSRPRQKLSRCIAEIANRLGYT